MRSLIISTQAHGFYDMMPDQFTAVDAFAPAGFRHLVIDDFSPEDQGERLQSFAGPVMRDGEEVGVREYLHSRSIGATEAPNITRGFRHAIMEGHRDPSCEAVFLLAYNCIINAETIPALQREHEAVPNAVLSCVQSVDGQTIQWFGGTDGSKMGLHRGNALTRLNEDGPSRQGLPWAHSATMWLPKSVLDDHRIRPDLAFRLYYADLDLSENIKRAGHPIIVVRRSWVHRVNRGASTAAFYGGESVRRHANQAAYAQFRRKWHL